MILMNPRCKRRRPRKCGRESSHPHGRGFFIARVVEPSRWRIPRRRARAARCHRPSPPRGTGLPTRAPQGRSSGPRSRLRRLDDVVEQARAGQPSSRNLMSASRPAQQARRGVVDKLALRIVRPSGRSYERSMLQRLGEKGPRTRSLNTAPANAVAVIRRPLQDLRPGAGQAVRALVEDISPGRDRRESRARRSWGHSKEISQASFDAGGGDVP